jgi:hypothetical protein
MTRFTTGRMLITVLLLVIAVGDLIAASSSTASARDELGLSLLLFTLPVVLLWVAALTSEKRSVIVPCVVAVVAVGAFVQISVLLSSEPSRSIMYLLSLVVYWVSAAAAVLTSKLLVIR